MCSVLKQLLNRISNKLGKPAASRPFLRLATPSFTLGGGLLELPWDAPRKSFAELHLMGHETWPAMLAPNVRTPTTIRSSEGGPHCWMRIPAVKSGLEFQIEGRDPMHSRISTMPSIFARPAGVSEQRAVS